MRLLPLHITAVAVAGALAVPAAASAADTTVTFRFAQYTPANITIAPNDTVTFKADEGHDFLAIPGPTHHPLVFTDPSIQGQAVGTTTKRTFSNVGTYAYYCAFHWSIGMYGSITVTPAGIPAPGPGQTPAPAAPAAVAPTATLRLPKNRSLKGIRRARGLTALVGSSAAGRATGTLRLGEQTVGTGSVTFPQPNRRALRVTLSTAGRRTLGRLRRARLQLVVTVVDSAGHARTIARSFTTTK